MGTVDGPQFCSCLTLFHIESIGFLNSSPNKHEIYVTIYTLAEKFMRPTLLKNLFCNWRLFIHFDVWLKTLDGYFTNVSRALPPPPPPQQKCIPRSYPNLENTPDSGLKSLILRSNKIPQFKVKRDFISIIYDIKYTFFLWNRDWLYQTFFPCTWYFS